MKIRTPFLTLGLLAALLNPAQASNVVLIGHPGLASKLDAALVQKIYTGKVIEVGGTPVTVINASSGSPIRQRFLQNYLNQDEEKYAAYWTVRRYIGKGAPPKELANSSDVINFVQNTPGAIGYIEESELKPGMNVLLKK
ncbi:MAG TPA: hypothetical protein VFK74_00275 [Azospira sp.]|nr:hypothetical protein [Azospira sp.]